MGASNRQFAKERIGEYLVRMREIRPNQVEIVLLRQQCGDRRPFGEIAVDLRYIRPSALYGYLAVESEFSWSSPEGSYSI